MTASIAHADTDTVPDAEGIVFCAGSGSDYDPECTQCWLGHSHNWAQHRANIDRAQLAARVWRQALLNDVASGRYDSATARRYYDSARIVNCWSLRWTDR